jgi:DNA-binding IclR family transcriptional regulator
VNNSNGIQSKRRKISSVQKAIDILNLFDANVTELGNKEIADKLHLPTSTVSGLVYTLKKNNYLSQNQESQKYMLGLKLLDRASVLLDQIDIRKIAYPQLKEISNWSGESVNLAVIDEGEIVYIERILSSHPLGIHYEIGKKQPIHSTALGKAIVSHLPQNEISSLLQDYHFFPVTQYTINEKNKFEDELAKIRERGYSIDDQENEIGGRCVSAPILNKNAYPIAAISISVPMQRMSDKQIEVFGEKMIDASSAISRIIGFRL